MATLTPLFLIGFSSFLQVTSTTITSRTSSNFDQIRSRAAELAALEHLENPHRLIMGEIDWIFFLLADNKNMHKSLNEFEFLPNPTTDYGVICPSASEKWTYNLVAIVFPSFLIGSSSLYPPQTVFVGGYTVFTLSVLPSVRPSVHPLRFVFLITLRVMDGISSNLAFTFISTGQILIIKNKG